MSLLRLGMGKGEIPFAIPRYTNGMLTRQTHGKLTWIDLASPTQQEVRSLIDEFGIEPLVAEELLLPTMRPRVEFYEQFVYLILRFPALQRANETLEQEVDFIIGKDFIITTRYDNVDPLHKFSKVFEVNSTLDKSLIGEHAGFVFYYMLKNMYVSVEHEVELLGSGLDDIEEKIFEGREKEMVAALSNVGRALLNLRQAIEPHRDILRSLEADGPTFFGKEFTPYLRALSNEYYRVHNRIGRQSESMRELRETNNSLVSTKQNEVMKTLTIMAFVTFPLSLIASVFGMNTDYLPVVGLPGDFWIVTGGMALGMVIMFGFFKYKKWL